ncbi:hypothetical protein ERJ75_000050100 [Trypanosoma vivax]|uniref:Uncharacterized protein n=1 Tax=Trypanosoma vivax (strain Y486) TaxID=1055687 RepID=G0U771_TRYVY|nr:hypothetical protein ERJ75_000050100 [Trypanosoma vivax]CCC51728.1 conserved hypothetical protein [Trypanosoma vivax Y486]
MLYHGSHPEHPIKPLSNFHADLSCSVCRASPHPSMVEWYVCVNEECGHTLCKKCQEVNEKMLENPHVIIRKPMIAYDDMDVCLRTRPRSNAHALCPLYPGQLMVAVSSARGTINPNETYYRLRSGGWINAAHVVRVIPSQQPIEELAREHLGDPQMSENRRPIQTLLTCIEESYRLMDDRSHYGPVMALLIFYPLMQYFANLPGKPLEQRKTLLQASLGFVHYVFHYVLEEVRNWLNDFDPKVKSTALTLYVELLGKSLTLAHDMAVSQANSLPSELGPLVIKTARTAVDLVPVLDSGNIQHVEAADVSLRAPSVWSHQVSFGEEQGRLLACCHKIVETAGWLLRHTPLFTYTLQDVNPFRVAVAFFPDSELLERRLCEVTTGLLERDPTAQKRVHDLDVLEVAVSLASRATCVESQLAVFFLIIYIVHKSPQNIRQIASLVIAPLIQLASKALNTIVASAAFECFAELAYSDPRLVSTCKETDGEEARSISLCSAVVQPRIAPYQVMRVYSVEGHPLMLCEHCSKSHLPPGSEVASESQMAYFHCHCRHCQDEKAVTGLSVRSIEPTEAAKQMLKGGITQLMLSWLRSSESAVTNAVGRLSLKIPVPDDVFVALYQVLLKQGLVGYTDAAFAVAAQWHLPVLWELQRRHPDAAISQYLQRERGLNSKGFLSDCTPGNESRLEDPDGLSPSPDVVVRSSDGASVLSTVSPPVLDLFKGPPRV